MNTQRMKGMVEHLIVRPYFDKVMWDFVIQDVDGDDLLRIKNRVGFFQDRSGLPIGSSSAEKLTLIFKNVSKNCLFEVIFFIKE